MTDGQFQLVIDDANAPERTKAKRLLFCSGKVFYTLTAARAKAGIDDTAIVRVEQLYPYPKKEIQQILAKYNAAEEIGWVQEEPQNRGAWTYMEPRLRELLPDNTILSYFGREEAASPATGSMKMHKIEEEELVDHALDLSARQASVAKEVASEKPATASKSQTVSG